jgi:hypothetical protein
MMPKNEALHRDHSHAIVTESYKLRNVDRVATHELLRCLNDGWFGWVAKIKDGA